MLIKKSQKYYDADANVGGEGTTPPAEPKTLETQPQNGEGDKEKNFRAMETKNRALQKQLDDIAKATAEAETAKLIENGKLQEAIDKLTKEKADLAEQFNTTARTSSITNELIKSGLTQEAANALLPSVMQKVQFGEGNNANNLAEVVANIKTNLPQLFEAPKAAPIGSMGIQATVNNNGVAIDPEKLTDSEYVQRNFAAVKEYMKNNN
jgi:hypothetical protein